MAEVIYGSELSQEIRDEMRQQIDAIKQSGNRVPCLAVVLVGDNPASISYVKGKEKAELDTTDKLMALFEKLNVRDDLSDKTLLG